MRWALLLSLSGCFWITSDPAIDIESPEGGTVVKDHEPVTFFVSMRDIRSLEDIALAVDGIAQSDVTVSPAPNGNECDPCQVRVTWSALNAKEGLRVIELQAITGGGRSPSAVVDLLFDDVPELGFITPSEDEDLLGVGEVHVEVAVIERGEATIDLEIDGVHAETKRSDECLSASGCSLRYTWDTSALPAGPHELHTTVTDNHGNVLQDRRTVEIDDTIDVSSLMVTNLNDESGTLEIEVYAFDDATNQFLGCAGSAHGTGPVDYSDVRYPISARLVSPTGETLRGSDLEGKSIRFEIWEDDDDPVCPTVLSPTGNDFVGKSPAKTVTAWKDTVQPIAFTNVPEFAFSIGRPLSK